MALLPFSAKANQDGKAANKLLNQMRPALSLVPLVLTGICPIEKRPQQSSR